MIGIRIHRSIERCLYGSKNKGPELPDFVFFRNANFSQKKGPISFKEKVRGFCISCQQELFPWVEEGFGSLPKRYQKLLMLFEMVCVADFLPRTSFRTPGRPRASRVSLARSFLAKMVLNIPTTADLRARLLSDRPLRSMCGWSRQRAVPSASTFSRAFKEFAESELPTRLHEALIEGSYADQLVGHISRDSTAIEAREKPLPKKKVPEPVKRKRGRPRKGEERPKVLSRLERQRTMGIDEMLADLPKDCTVGSKRNAKGHTQSWTGYKLHMDVADGGVPISCLVSSASLHDSQAAIPLATMTDQRVDNCYDLMDSAYDAREIHAHRTESGRVPSLTRIRVIEKRHTVVSRKRSAGPGLFHLSGCATGNVRPWSGRLGASRMSLVHVMYAGTAR